MKTFRKLLELIRFSHTVFALPFALLAACFALSLDESKQLVSLTNTWKLAGIILCMVFARSAAMAFNRLVDAKIDALNPRTAQRHIPAGTLSAFQVWIFFLTTAGLFFASCLLFLPNWLPIGFSAPVLVWICGYSYAKRFTSAAHLWLGVALALAPVCTWVALRGSVVLQTPSDCFPAIILGLAITFWVTGFDIIYACQDATFDKNSGLRSVPSTWGLKGSLRIASLLHVAMLAVLFALPLLAPQLSLGWLYLSATIFVAALVVRQHLIVSPDDLRRVGEAFFTINAIISLGFCTLAGIDALM